MHTRCPIYLQVSVVESIGNNALMFEIDDWMNEYWPTREDKDDYQFVYIGGDSTFTPLHADVYR